MSDVMTVELLMHAVRLVRSGNYLQLAQLRKALKADFPEALPAQITEALQQLARRHLEGGA